jgi:hypothetical protein
MGNMLDQNVSLLQQFLTYSATLGPVIIEVGFTDSNKIVCNCNRFLSNTNCKHARFVKYSMEKNNGVYDNGVSHRATKQDKHKATLSSKNRREFVARFGTIEVI